MNRVLDYLVSVQHQSLAPGRLVAALPPIVAALLVLVYGPGDFDPVLGYTYPAAVLVPVLALGLFGGIAIWRLP